MGAAKIPTPDAVSEECEARAALVAECLGWPKSHVWAVWSFLSDPKVGLTADPAESLSSCKLDNAENVVIGDLLDTLTTLHTRSVQAEHDANMARLLGA